MGRIEYTLNRIKDCEQTLFTIEDDFKLLVQDVEKCRDILTSIRMLAKRVQNDSSGHFCEAKVCLQSIIDQCNNGLSE